MRLRDENKKEAIILATVKLVNEIGFVNSSVSKIAKEANVSPATLYIYYKNKEDLLISTYIEVKLKLGDALLKDFDDSLPLRDIFYKLWINGFEFIRKNRPLFLYTEQFSNSPYSDLVNHEEVEKHFQPFFKILQKGIEQKIIKDVPFDLINVFIFFPVLTLSNSKLCKSVELNEKTIEKAFTLAWDAIKL